MPISVSTKATRAQRSLVSRASLAVLTTAAALTLAACSSTGTSTTIVGGSPASELPPAGDSCAGVGLYVDFGDLAAEDVSACVEVDDAGVVTGPDLLAAAGVVTEGTAEYGDAIVCRVNGSPAADEEIVVEGEAPFTESCESMPPMYAYWSLWLKPAADAEWEYAPTGISELELTAGQTVGLVWTTGSEQNTPDLP